MCFIKFIIIHAAALVIFFQFPEVCRIADTVLFLGIENFSHTTLNCIACIFCLLIAGHALAAFGIVTFPVVGCITNAFFLCQIIFFSGIAENFFTCGIFGVQLISIGTTASARYSVPVVVCVTEALIGGFIERFSNAAFLNTCITVVIQLIAVCIDAIVLYGLLVVFGITYTLILCITVYLSGIAFYFVAIGMIFIRLIARGTIFDPIGHCL